MLTRLLGAEKTALAGNWKHPFADVPQWADKYVGWLYQNGLTKGVSATKYGSQRNVTCDQYCIFLTRAHLDADSYQGTAFVDNDEVRQTDEEGFIRGDAVSLSARLLGTNYAKMRRKRPQCGEKANRQRRSQRSSSKMRHGTFCRVITAMIISMIPKETGLRPLAFLSFQMRSTFNELTANILRIKFLFRKHPQVTFGVLLHLCELFFPLVYINVLMIKARGFLIELNIPILLHIY